MLEALFGADMPLAVRFFLAFLIVLGLIGATAWAVRRFGAGRLGGAGARGRQPRLAVIDYASVDSRRRLILVRRDNIEHLVLIGGPTDVVVEANIVRAAPATREAAVTRPPPAAETLPRAIPLPENGNGSWPLQPEPMGSPRPGRASNLTSSPLGRCRNTVKRGRRGPARETLAAIADEIASRPVPHAAQPPREVPRDHVRWSRAASHVRNPERSRACRRPRGARPAGGRCGRSKPRGDGAPARSGIAQAQSPGRRTRGSASCHCGPAALT